MSPKIYFEKILQVEKNRSKNEMLEQLSYFFLGFQVNSYSRSVSFTKSAYSCVHQVMVNDQMLDLTGGVQESHEVDQCSSLVASECGNNVCGKNGICRKTIDCNDPITSKYYVLLRLLKNSRQF